VPFHSLQSHKIGTFCVCVCVCVFCKTEQSSCSSTLPWNKCGGAHGSSMWSLSSRFPHQNPVCTSPRPIRATCPTHLFRLDFITRIKFCEEYRSLIFSLCSFLHSHVTSSLLFPNILLSTLFSNTLSLCSSLIVSDQVSHPYKTTGKTKSSLYLDL
jgi:hypothetical protein